MAEAFGIVAGSLTVLEITMKIIQQCKTLVETAHDAPRGSILRFIHHIVITTTGAENK